MGSAVDWCRPVRKGMISYAGPARIRSKQGECGALKKVLGLVASERRLGNTEMLVKAVLANTGDDCAKEMIRLTELNLKYCKACYTCLPEDVGCCLKDDLAFLLDKLKEADAVVLGAPVYCFGPHGVIKVLQDRLFSVGSKQELFQGKRCVTITTYGVPGWEGYARSVLNQTAHLLHLELVDSLLIHGANPGEVWLNPATLERVSEVGRLLIDPGYGQSPGANRCPACWGDFFKFKGDGSVECPLCGTKGRVDSNGEQPVLSFANSGSNRISPEGRREHFKWLTMKKAEFLAKRHQLKELQKPYAACDWWVKPPAGQLE